MCVGLREGAGGRGFHAHNRAFPGQSLAVYRTGSRWRMGAFVGWSVGMFMRKYWGKVDDIPCCYF